MSKVEDSTGQDRTGRIGIVVEGIQHDHGHTPMYDQVPGRLYLYANTTLPEVRGIKVCRVLG